MKTLGACLESLLADDDIFLDPENDKKIIEEWIKDNYIIRGKLTISNDLIVDCDWCVEVKNKNITSLTNDLFRWGKINNSFNCSGCDDLKSLKGAPEKVGYDFGCSECSKLESLKGAPKEVGGNFDCSYCNSLTSLEGAPKEVGGFFNCRYCKKLKSLKDAPEKVGGGFFCDGCKKLKITDSDREKYSIEM